MSMVSNKNSYHQKYGIFKIEACYLCHNVTQMWWILRQTHSRSIPKKVYAGLVRSQLFVGFGNIWGNLNTIIWSTFWPMTFDLEETYSLSICIFADSSYLFSGKKQIWFSAKFDLSDIMEGHRGV